MTRNRLKWMWSETFFFKIYKSACQVPSENKKNRQKCLWTKSYWPQLNIQQIILYIICVVQKQCSGHLHLDYSQIERDHSKKQLNIIRFTELTTHFPYIIQLQLVGFSGSTGKTILTRSESFLLVYFDWFFNFASMHFNNEPCYCCAGRQSEVPAAPKQLSNLSLFSNVSVFANVMFPNSICSASLQLSWVIETDLKDNEIIHFGYEGG